MSDAVYGSAGHILSRAEARTGRPLRAMIEISDRCNEVCVHCYQEQGRKGEMTTEQIKAIMDELAELGVLILTISGGEATLRHDFLELVEHARLRGFAVRIFTNGLTMTEQLARRLSELAVHVVEISVYSHRAEVHDFVTGVPGSFAKTVAGIRHLRGFGVDVHIKTPIMTVNEHELDEYVAFAEQLGVTYGLDPTELMPREAESREPEAFTRDMDTWMRVHRDPRFQRMAVAPPRANRDVSTPLCGAGEALVVEPNGELRACTMLEANLGDARAGVGRALSGAGYAQVRALRWADAHGCRDCDLRGYCGRCHASALAEVGDALAPYPTACQEARARYELGHGIAPAVTADGFTSAAVGPYRRIGEHAFERIPDVITTEDDALAARLGWIRRPGAGLAAPGARARPGALVQLRRPGRKRATPERVPAFARAGIDSVRPTASDPLPK